MEKSSNSIIKIAIIGPESTGKSTLAQALAAYYHEPWVPEIARNYIANLNTTLSFKRYFHHCRNAIIGRNKQDSKS
jgi:nicotinamide riboside kinase